MRRSVFGCALLAAVAIAAWSCGSKDEGLDPDVDKLGRASGPIEQAPRAAQPAGMPPQGMMTAGSADGAKTVHEGDVIERIHVPNYTYLRLRVAGGGETWAAIPKTEIEGTKPGISSMPANLTDHISRHEMRDLIEYLALPK